MRFGHIRNKRMRDTRMHARKGYNYTTLYSGSTSREVRPIVRANRHRGVLVGTCSSTPLCDGRRAFPVEGKGQCFR